MKRILMAFPFALLLGAAAAIAQQPALHIHAREISHDGPVTTARDDATLTNGTVEIHADSIVYNRESGEAQAAGSVRIKFLAKSRPSSGLQGDPTLTPLECIERLQRRPGSPEIWPDR